MILKRELDYEELSHFEFNVTAVDSDKGMNSTKIKIQVSNQPSQMKQRTLKTGMLGGHVMTMKTMVANKCVTTIQQCSHALLKPSNK